jgi:signal transduction histidine kinase
MPRFKTYRFLQFFLMAYLIAAFSWWTILLSQKNKENYELRTEILKFNNPAKVEALEEEYKRSQWMIIGEGFVFAVSILVSLLLVNRAFWTEIKANKKLNNFLLSVTHELKTPVASLKLINKTLTHRKLDSDKSLELLKTAQDETIRLESLVNNILTAAQMDNNYDYNFESIDLNNIIKERILRFRKIYENIDIQLIDKVDKANIKADKESIVKLVDNLLDNAIKYSDKKDPVVLQLEKVGNKVKFVVADLGIGIKDSEKKRILDKFYRVGDENTRASKGTGLGLFIVKEICRAHKATIRIQDNQPKGTRFIIEFPGL